MPTATATVCKGCVFVTVPTRKAVATPNSQVERMTRQERKEKFLEFHRNNPHVLKFMLRTIRQLKSRGLPRVTIAMIFEYTRVQQALKTTSKDGFKISNDFKPWYARKINKTPGYEDTFVIKALKK